MNCEEYREAIGADPNFDGGATHVAECEACQVYRREMLELDAQINRALAIAVPELKMPELEDIDTGNVTSLDARRNLMKPVWLAAAATVLIAAFVTVRLGSGPAYNSLAEEVLAHVDHAPSALIPTDQKVSDGKLNRVVPATMAELNHDAGLITFAETCPISGNDVPHLVIQGKKGPITIMLLPDEKISEAILLNDEDSHGVILPVGDGSIAIVGSRDENLEDVKKQMLQSVTWDT